MLFCGGRGISLSSVGCEGWYIGDGGWTGIGGGLGGNLGDCFRGNRGFCRWL